MKQKHFIFHEALCKLQKNTNVKYRDDLHVYKIIQASWNLFKPTKHHGTFSNLHTHTHTFVYKSYMFVIPPWVKVFRIIP